MRTQRRGFLRLVAGGLAALVAPRARAGRKPVSAREIHQSTVNTLLGALGARLWQRSKPEELSANDANRSTRKLPRPFAQQALTLRDVTRSYAATNAFSDAGVSAAELSRLLHFTNGVTGRRGNLALRAAPSAGALYAGEVYVVAERVAGLAPGIYAYRPAEHQLLMLREGRFGPELGRALEWPASAEAAPVAFLLTNVFARYAWRYANRAYRYALIDSGHIGENLRLCARSAGLGESAPLRFHDDHLNALLRIDGREEAVCALHLVGRSAGAAKPPGEPTRRLAEKARAAPATIPSGWKVTERYHEATKLVPVASVAAAEKLVPVASAPAAEKLVPIAPTADSPHVDDPGQERLARNVIALPDEEPSFPLAVEEAIGARRSAERFEAEPVRLDTLNFLLKTVRANSALTRSEGVDLYLVVHRVKGLPAGLYRYDPPARLVRLERGDLRARMVRACLRQTKAGNAALGVLMVAQLADSALQAGDRSYRDLLLEAGALGQRLYLAAEAAGLRARNLAAFLDADLNALTGLDGTREAVVHLTMVGRGT